jgi:hypothetical protein
MTRETMHRDRKKGEKGPGSLLLGLGKKKDVGEVEAEPDKRRTITSP